MKYFIYGLLAMFGATILRAAWDVIQQERAFRRLRKYAEHRRATDRVVERELQLGCWRCKRRYTEPLHPLFCKGEREQ
jgi:hypothetical protein